MEASRTGRVEIVAIRHGKTRWNVEGRIQGHLDSGLTDLGIRQAGAIAESFAGERLDRVYASDLPRARITAEEIGRRTGAPVLTDERLRERHHGIFQGLTIAECRARYPEEYEAYSKRLDPDRPIPEGESLRGKHDRAVTFFEEVARKEAGRRIAVVTHGGILDSLFRLAVGLDILAPRRFSLRNAGRNVVSFAGGKWTLEIWGDVRHLAGLEPASPYEF
jgi:probable phosphoglycerate mutase